MDGFGKKVRLNSTTATNVRATAHRKIPPFSRVKLLPCPPQALSPADTGQPAPSACPLQEACLRKLFQQTHRAGGFTGRIQQPAPYRQLTEPPDGKCSARGCQHLPRSRAALRQALTPAGLGNHPRNQSRRWGHSHNPQPFSACAPVPVLQAGAPVLQQLPQTRITPMWTSSAPSGKLQEFLLGVLRKPPPQSRASQGDTETPPGMTTAVGGDRLVTDLTNPATTLPRSHGIWWYPSIRAEGR